MLIRIFGYLIGLLLTIVMLSGLILSVYIWRIEKQLPHYTHLKDYSPAVMTRVHAGEGKLIAEFAKEYRIFVPIQLIPKPLIFAFLSAEDKNFYSHSGVDIIGLTRAVSRNILSIFSGKRFEGASTITQQIAKNFLLTSDRTIQRKLKEVMLAIRLEMTFSKEELLELYLNEIYLGVGRYGVAAAALNYFDKSLNELTIAEIAYLAALPKAPNNYHPFRKRERAIARRNWVIGRMYHNQYITKEQYEEAMQEPFVITPRRNLIKSDKSAYFVEAVRRKVKKIYGNKQLYNGGLSIRSTLDLSYQKIAVNALRKGLIAYDRRHGWRGAVKTVDIEEDWKEELKKVPIPSDLVPWRLAIVMAVNETEAEITLRPRRNVEGKFENQSDTGKILLKDIKWARKEKKNGRLGAHIQKVADVLSIGDIIWVNKIGKTYALQQIPEINGGLVAMDPHTGRVLAMVGGFSYDISEFNRVVQAKRQPGSAFKPFVYAAALDSGYTPASLVLDGPFVIEQGQDLGLWKPENYGKKFYGLSTLRLGIEKSRNLMTVRLAQEIGMKKIVDYAKRFNISQNMPAVLSMALGAGETSLLKITTAYGMLVNGGKYIKPIMIDRIQDRYGKTIYRYDQRICDECQQPWVGQEAPELVDQREQVLNQQTAYQIVSMLEGVVVRGTGRSIKKIGKPLAGKTGTTNDSRDAWFIGFSPDLMLGVYVGFDTPRSLGDRETGGYVAAPVFRDFMSQALKDRAVLPFRIPPGINLIRINQKTGELAKPSDRSVFLEAFKVGTEPKLRRKKIENTVIQEDKESILGLGTGGLY